MTLRPAAPALERRQQPMNTSRRLIITCTLLAFGLGGQLAARAYLEAPGPLPRVELAQPLAELPLELPPWRGFDVEPEDEDSVYGDEYLQREYRHAQANQVVALWVSYSRSGEDRGHHPEVCMAVAGKSEDRNARRTCPVEGPGGAVQQYRFTGPLERPQWVFYWHYTLEPPPRERQLSRFQHLYQRLRRRPSSVTIEVFAPESSPDTPVLAQQFVRLVDQALHRHLGPTAVRGSERLPVTIVDPDQMPPAN